MSFPIPNVLQVPPPLVLISIFPQLLIGLTHIILLIENSAPILTLPIKTPQYHIHSQTGKFKHTLTITFLTKYIIGTEITMVYEKDLV